MSKKIKLQFHCDQDTEKMSKTETGRHCAQCSKNIVDFSQMKPAEIVAHLKSANRPCGYMLPWQLDDVNAHIESQSKIKSSVLHRATKIAAMLTAPLAFTQANAQTEKEIIPVEQTQSRTNVIVTEVLVKDKNGEPIRHKSFDVYQADQLLGSIRSAADGKITIDHRIYGKYSSLTLKQKDSGETKEITIQPQGVCYNWLLNMTEGLCKFDFIVTEEYNDREQKLGLIPVEIEFYDADNEVIRKISKRTSASGKLNIAWSDIEKSTNILITAYTSGGKEVRSFKPESFKKEEINEMRYYYFKEKQRIIRERYLPGVYVAY